jgi:hypothetical protein
VATYLLGYAGAALVAYSLIAEVTVPWLPVERFARTASDILTVVGVIVTAGSIYFPFGPEQEPWRVSRWVTAPLVIMTCVGAGVAAVVYGSLPPVLVNGLALVGLSGALQRIVPIDVADVTNAKARRKAAVRRRVGD